MTDEARAKVIAVIKGDSDEYLLERYVYFVQTFNPIDAQQRECYELIKAEILRRMGND